MYEVTPEEFSDFPQAKAGPSTVLPKNGNTN
jgi:hypothetical protein